MVDMPELVRGGQLTEFGRKVIALVETTLDQAESLIEGQDLAALNALSGPFQDYYINVRKMGLHDSASWLKDRPYASFALWRMVEEQEQAVQKAVQVDTLETRLAKLEEQMIKALEAIQIKDAEIAALKADAGPVVETVEVVAEPEPEPKKRKTAKAPQEPEPADPAAEPNAEGEPDKDAEKAEA